MTPSCFNMTVYQCTKSTKTWEINKKEFGVKELDWGNKLNIKQVSCAHFTSVQQTGRKKDFM